METTPGPPGGLLAPIPGPIRHPIHPRPLMGFGIDLSDAVDCSPTDGSQPAHAVSIINMQTELLQTFEVDINSALRDLAGIAVVSNYNLIGDRERLDKSLVIKPVFPSVVSLSFDDSKDGFRSLEGMDIRHRPGEGFQS